MSLGVTAKITSLLIRTLAKPVAVTIKTQAKQHATFRKVCIDTAQFLHRTETRLSKGLGPASSLVKIRPLNDARAIEMGANFFSEFFMFSVAGSIIIVESLRARSKANTRREGIADDIQTLQNEVEFIKANLRKRNLLDPPAGS